MKGSFKKIIGSDVPVLVDFSSFLKLGAGVTTTRAHVHYAAAEHGVVNLFGKSLKKRAKALISIAHPDHQEQLERRSI